MTIAQEIELPIRNAGEERMLRRIGAIEARATGPDSVAPHQARHAVLADPFPMVAQRAMHTRTTVALATGAMHVPNALDQIQCFARPRARLTTPPRVVTPRVTP